MQKSYITSAIYYVNDVPHIGHLYTTILCDMLKRYKQLKGESVLFLTGTDEHGQKIAQSAQKHNQSPQAYADTISKAFRDLWDRLGLDYDMFVRTTDAKHCAAVQKAFEIMYEKGDIYKGSYVGHYCISCESFFTKTQLVDNDKCPDCGKITQIVEEESYFFALSKYEKPLLDFYSNNPSVIMPQFRQNEVISFIKDGLNDLSITRTSFEWGIPLLPNAKRKDSKKHVMYVWLDALLSYVTPLGYLQDNAKMAHWENAVHFVGKDILRFHAVYWIAFLLSLELPLPKHIYAHGWWTKDGAKMSKSIGNVIDPKALTDAYGVESVRYFLMREMPFGQDGDFSQRALIERINAELGNDLGNLLNRLQGMSEKYFNLALDSSKVAHYFSSELSEVESIIASAIQKLDTMQPQRYIEELWRAFSLANGAIAKYEPWNLIKHNENDKTMALLALIANILAKGALLLYPIMPESAKKIASVFQITLDSKSFEAFITKGHLLPHITLAPIAPLFPRIEAPLMPESSPNVTKNAPDSSKDSASKEANLVDITDFKALDLRVGTIVACEAVPKSEKLLKLMVDIGEDSPRQIISGIAKHYAPESLLNRQICIIANLKPAKLMGYTSDGMILASSDTNGLSLLSIDSPRVNGSKIS